jgi:hypothetical protein
MHETKLFWLVAMPIVISALMQEHICLGQETNWTPRVEDLQFGITASIGGVREQSPSSIEPDYKGAFVFGCCSYYGIGQTFTVPTFRTLESLELRVGGFRLEPTTGQIEIAILRFDSNAGLPREKLAAVLADAADYYLFDVTNVPVTSFDFSKFELLLSPAETYALSVTPTSTFEGGGLTIQSNVDVYTGGRAYLVFVVPEPSTGALVLCTTSVLALRRRR